MRKREYVLVGHFTKDILNEREFQIGGTVYYGGFLAQKMGFSVKIFTSFGKDLKKHFPKQFLKKVKIFNFPSKHTTTFQNIYKNKEGKRVQFLFQKAKKIPSNWILQSIKKEPEIFHLAPVFQEINPSFLKRFKKAFLGATLQGFLRKQNKDFSVSFCFWKDYKKYLPFFDAAICSIEDLKQDLKLAKEFSKYPKIFVLTQGKKGCLLFEKGKVVEILPKKVLFSGNFTGAGDVFATAFFIKFFETKNAILSAHFAHKIAGLHIQSRF